MIEMSLRAKKAFSPERSRRGSNLTISYIVVFLLACVLYILTCAPGVLWQDSGMFQYRILHNDIEGNGGLAVAHPLYVIIGIGISRIPFGELAYRVNLISAIFGAFTIANLFLLMRLWLGKTLPAAIAAVTLALSHTLWLHSTIAECYTLYTALLIAELIMLLQYVKTKRILFLYLLAVFNGLAIANHIWGIFGLTCYTMLLIVLLARKQIALKHLGIIILLWVIGAAPLEYLIIKDIISSSSIQTTMASAVFGDLWKSNVLNTSISMKMVAENIIFLLLNFPTPNFVFFFIGLYSLRKLSPSRSLANIILTLLTLFYVFAFRYNVTDRHAFFLPFYCLAAILIALGTDFVLSRYNRRVLIFMVLAFTLLPIPIYFFAPALAGNTYKRLGQRRQLPYRDDYKYFLQPWKTGYNGAERFASEAFNAVEPNAIIYTDHTAVHPLLYLQEVKGRRSDVKIVSRFDNSRNAPIFNEETIAQLIKRYKVYVVSPLRGYCPGFLLDHYDFVQVGILWRAVERK